MKDRTRTAGKLKSRTATRSSGGLRRQALLLAIAVAAITFLCFSPALKNQFLQWDDISTLVENDRYKGLGWENLRWMATTYHMGPYQPLSWLTYALDNQLWRGDPLGFHLTNLLLHSANAALLLFLALALLERGKVRSRSSGALLLSVFFATLFYAVHPLRVESVAWATERRDVLSGLFFLVTMLAYLRAVEPARAAGRRPVWFAGAVVAYALTLGAKGTAMTLPVLLVILDIYPLRRLAGSPARWFDRAYRQVWLEKIPFLLLGIGAAIMALRGQAEAETLIELTVLDRLAIAAHAVVFYAQKTLLPVGLLPLYELPVDLDPLSPRYVLSALAVLGVTMLLLIKRQRAAPILVAWLFFLILLAPVSGLAQAGLQIAADRYTYLPSMAWTVPLALGLSAALERRVDGRKIAPGLRTAAVIPLAAIIVVLGTLTWRQTLVWRSTTSLWEHTVTHDPKANLARLYLAEHLLDLGATSRAINEFERFLDTAPAHATRPAHLSHAHSSLAIAYAQEGKPDIAIAHCRQAEALGPTLAEEHNGLGKAYGLIGDVDRAIAHLEKAVALDPGMARAHANLGNAYAQKGEFERALAQLDTARRIQPGLPRISQNQGIIYLRMGRSDEAVAAFRHELERDPASGESHYNLAVALYSAGDYALAWKHLNQARALGARINPAFVETLREASGKLGGETPSP